MRRGFILPPLYPLPLLVLLALLPGDSDSALAVLVIWIAPMTVITGYLVELCCIPFFRAIHDRGYEDHEAMRCVYATALVMAIVFIGMARLSFKDFGEFLFFSLVIAVVCAIVPRLFWKRGGYAKAPETLPFDLEAWRRQSKR